MPSVKPDRYQGLTYGAFYPTVLEAIYDVVRNLYGSTPGDLAILNEEVVRPRIHRYRVRWGWHERSVDIEGTWDGVEEVDYDDDDIVESDDDFPF